MVELRGITRRDEVRKQTCRARYDISTLRTSTNSDTLRTDCSLDCSYSSHGSSATDRTSLESYEHLRRTNAASRADGRSTSTRSRFSHTQHHRSRSRHDACRTHRTSSEQEWRIDADGHERRKQTQHSRKLGWTPRQGARGFDKGAEDFLAREWARRFEGGQSLEQRSLSRFVESR